MSYADCVNDQSIKKKSSTFHLDGTRESLRRFYVRLPRRAAMAKGAAVAKGEDMDALLSVRLKKARAGKKLSTANWRILEKAQTLGAVLGLMGGLLAALFGSLFTLVSWFSANEVARHSISNMGTTLLFLTIPLLILGGYCMDRLDKDKPYGRSRISADDDDDE